MRTLLTTFLTVVFFATASADAVTGEEAALLQRWSNQVGRLLNAFTGTPSARIQQAEKEIETLLITRIKDHPDFDKYHWKILIYHSDMHNAFAYMTTPEMGEEKKWNDANGNRTWPIRKALNIQDDKPIAFIGITTKMLERLKTKGQLAFVLGHEAKHIYDRHGVTGPGLQATASKWMDTQGKEVIADLGSVEFMVGHDPLESALEALDMFDDDAKNHESNTLRKHLTQGAEASVQTHHHPSVRQSIVQSRIAFLNRFDKRAIVPASDPIPVHWKNIAGKPLESPRLGEAMLKKYKEMIEIVKEQPEFAPMLSYMQVHNDIMERETVEALKNSQSVVSSFLDTLSSSEMSAHKKAMVAITFLVRQMEFPGWQKYFSSISAQETLRWKRLLVGLSPESISQNIFTADRDYLNYRDTLFSLLERGVLANGFSDDVIKRNPVWLDLIRKYMIPFAIQNQMPEDSAPRFQKITEVLGLDKSEILSRTVSKISHAGQIHRELVLKTVETLESYPIDRFLRVKEKGYEDVSQQLKFLLTTHKIIQAPENKLALKDAGLNTVVDRLWIKHHPLIRSEVFENMRMLISLPKLDEHIKLAENTGASLSVLFSLDKNVINDSEFHDLLVKLLNKLMLGSPSEVMLTNRLGILTGLDQKTSSKLVLKILSNSKLAPEVRFRAIFGLYWGFGEPFDKLIKNDPHIRANLRLILQKMGADTLAGQAKILTGAAWNQYYKATIPQTGTLERGGEASSLLGFQSHQLSMFQAILATGLIPRLFDETADLLIKEMKWNLSTISRTGIDYLNSEHRSPMSGADILVDWIVSKSSSLKQQRDFLAWFLKYEEIRLIVSKSYILSSSQKDLAGQAITRGLKLMPKGQLQKALKRSSVSSSLSDQQFADLIIDYLMFVAPVEKGKDVLRIELTRVEKELNFNDINSDIKNKVYNKLAEVHQVQPLELTSMFPTDSRTDTEKYNGKYGLVRMLSGVVSFLEKRTAVEQLQAIDYLVGRMSTVPSYFKDVQSELNSLQIKLDINRYVTMARSRLSSASVMERTVAINNLLGGKDSFFNSPGGHEETLDYLVKSIPPSQAKIVKDFGGAVMRAEGRHASLFASYVLSQKDSTPKNGPMSIELLIKGILDFYGVPGWKLAQYLGFSGEFKQFESALAQYQDAAFPPDYLEILIYLRDHYTEKLDFTKIKILKILGTGSVNIAIEYLDLADNKTKVINIPRQNIKNQTKRDFERFRLFITEVMKSTNAKQYEFLVGLMSTIEKSVNLEFDRAAVLQRQMDAMKIYNAQTKGWKIRTVEAHGSIDDIILMEKAYGLGATKVIKSDPNLYKSALGALYDFEFKHLKGQLQSGNDDFIKLANPDLHDGQVFIDKASMTVTIIDFGQAVPLNSPQRSLGIDILSFLGGLISPESYIQKLQAHRLPMGWSKSMTVSDLAAALERPEPMDRFVQLISIHSKVGMELPLPTVHWILGMNRLRTLGKKIGIHPDISIAKMVYGKIVKEKASDLVSKAQQLISNHNRTTNMCRKYYGEKNAN